MDFTSAVQAACYDKVQGWLKELFGEMFLARTDAPVFLMRQSSTTVMVIVTPWNDDAVLNVMAWVVSGAEPSQGLLKYLLNLNTGLRFGAFGMDEAGDIAFRHSILGSTLDRDELKASIFAVLSTADDQGTKIVAGWGGCLWKDKPTAQAS